MTKKTKTSNRRWQLGNFYVKEQGVYIEASDFSGMWRLKAHKGSIQGLTLLYLCAKDSTTAEIYLKMLWAIGNITPDNQFMEDMLKAYQARLTRQPKEEEQDDEAAIEEIQKLEAFLNMPEDLLREELQETQDELNNALAQTPKEETPHDS